VTEKMHGVTEKMTLNQLFARSPSESVYLDLE
jgi:hypothetical protein